MKRLSDSESLSRMLAGAARFVRGFPMVRDLVLTDHTSQLGDATLAQTLSAAHAAQLTRLAVNFGREAALNDGWTAALHPLSMLQVRQRFAISLRIPKECRAQCAVCNMQESVLRHLLLDVSVQGT